MTEQEDVNEVDMIAYAPEESDGKPFNMAIDDTSEDPTIVMGKLGTTAFVSADVRIPTEKVGCLQVTSQLKEFLNHFPPESKEKAFEQIYKILQVLDAYLIDNPQQHLARSFCSQFGGVGWFFCWYFFCPYLTFGECCESVP